MLEPVTVYLMLAKAQYENKALAGNYNVGPDDSDCWTTGELVDLFCKNLEAGDQERTQGGKMSMMAAHMRRIS